MNKFFCVVSLLIIIVSCKKKEQTAPDTSWRKILSCSPYDAQGVVYKNSLYFAPNTTVFSDNPIIYRISEEGLILNKTEIKRDSLYKLNLYKDFYVNIYRPVSDSFTFTLNSYPNTASSISINTNWVPYKSNSAKSYFQFCSDNFDTITPPAMILGGNGTGLYQLKVNVDSSTGEVTNVDTTSHAMYNFGISSYTNLRVVGFNYKYLVEPVYPNQTTYVFTKYGNALYDKFDNQVISPQCVFNGELYAFTGTGISKSTDLENWTWINTRNNAGAMTVINNKLTWINGINLYLYNVTTDSYIKGYDMKGLTGYQIRFITQFNNHIFVATDEGLFVKKLEDFN